MLYSRPRPKRSPQKRAATPPRWMRRESELFWSGIFSRELGAPRIIPPADCQVALVYPNTYQVGMSSLGYQMVYRWINEQPGALAERFFVGAADELPALPTLSVETRRPLEHFDLVAFSISYELDSLNVVRFLRDNRVTLLAAERHPKAEPIVVLGGICLLVNRLPLYDLADVLVVGDGEGIVIQIVKEWCDSRGDRAHFLKAISALEGVQVTEGACRRFKIAVSDQPPAVSQQRLASSEQQSAVSGQPSAISPQPSALGGPQSAIRNPQSEIGNPKSKIQNLKSIVPHFVASLDSSDAHSMIVTPHTEFGARCLVEIARGCPYRCRFCFMGHSLPYRPRPFEAVREMLDRARRLTPRFGLIAPAVGSHPDIDRICEWCRSEGLEISFSSLRLEDVTPAMLDLLAASGQRSVTIAPEAGSERLRRLIGKRLSDDQVIAFAAEAAARGLTDLRLYFMVGLPTEQEEDIEAIARLIAATYRAALAARPQAGRAGILPASDRGDRLTTCPTTPNRKSKIENRKSLWSRPPRIEANVAVFIPKPATPLAEMETPSSAQVKKHLKRLAALVGRLDGVLFRMPSVAEAEAQKILTWADRDILQTLTETAREGGSWRSFVNKARKSKDEGKREK